ncbi:Alpha-galactosidase [Fusarium sp. LHS14.1]|nr:Alpha-galactosidase [Fusarium sp. LHS14.1]
MKSSAASAAQEAGDKVNTKKSWPLWKKLAIVGIILIIVIPLAVGLGVGLSKNKGGDDDSSGDDDQDDSGSGDDTSGGDTNRTSIWQPEVGAAWQIILIKPIEIGDDGKVTPDVDIYDIDLYDNDESTFSALHKAGKKVICYFSAGSWEDWRDDKDDFDETDLGDELDGWPDERWLNVSSPAVRTIIKKRIEYAADKGCDAIDPDNVDGFQNENGLGLTSDDAVSFVKFLADTAASFNMSTGLKNAGDIIPDVISDVHFSVNEQCVEYAECETFAEFVDNDKPVFHIEYPKGTPNKVSSKDASEICSQKGKAAGTENFSTVIKTMDLNGWVQYCDGKKYTTDVDS